MEKLHNQNGSDSPMKDFINLNKSVILQWKEYHEAKKYHATDETHAKALIALHRKEQIEEEKRNKNLF